MCVPQLNHSYPFSISFALLSNLKLLLSIIFDTFEPCFENLRQCFEFFQRIHDMAPRVHDLHPYSFSNFIHPIPLKQAFVSVMNKLFLLLVSAGAVSAQVGKKIQQLGDAAAKGAGAAGTAVAVAFVEEKFSKFSGEPRDAREILCV